MKRVVCLIAAIVALATGPVFAQAPSNASLSHWRTANLHDNLHGWGGAGYDSNVGANVFGELWFTRPLPSKLELIFSAAAVFTGGVKASVGVGVDAEGDLIAADIRGVIYANDLNGEGIEAGVAVMHVRLSAGYAHCADAKPYQSFKTGWTYGATYRLLLF